MLAMLAIVILAVLLSATVLMGWKITHFLHAEVIHHEMMALGDSRERSLMERLKTGIICWLPWGGFTLVSILFVTWSLTRTVRWSAR